MVGVSYWRKIIALLTLLFFANMGFAAICDFECSIFEARPAQSTMSPEASASSAAHHHSGHDSQVLSSSTSSPAFTAVSMQSSLCEHPVQVTSEFRIASNNPAVNVMLSMRSTPEPMLGNADSIRVQTAESPPSLSKVPLQISLRI